MIFWSCQESPKKTIPIKPTPKKQPSTVLKTSLKVLPEGLVDVQQINAAIQIDLKYTTTDNFLRERLYTSLQKAYLQKDVALRLSEVQKELSRQYPGYQLLIYDAVRPLSVQEKMWKALDSLPIKERIKFVSNPKNLSLHNMGAAIDLTILNANGVALDMGAGFDDIRKIAYPCLEDSFLKVGQLTPLQVQNRQILRSAMLMQGFRQLPTEWWHFNACSREEAKRKYKVLYLEP
jgi:D-alanyl-D-alanine dipeptidase